MSERAQHLWRTLVPRAARSVERQTLLQAALESLDRVDEARRLILAEGLLKTTTATGAVHLHPAARVERESKMQFIRIWEILHLAWNRELDGVIEP